METLGRIDGGKEGWENWNRNTANYIAGGKKGGKLRGKRGNNDRIKVSRINRKPEVNQGEWEKRFEK